MSICAHLQMHRSLSASLVLKSLPGWLMLLILPADPVRPFRWILGAWRGEEGDERGLCRRGTLPTKKPFCPRVWGPLGPQQPGTEPSLWE